VSRMGAWGWRAASEQAGRPGARTTARSERKIFHDAERGVVLALGYRCEFVMVVTYFPWAAPLYPIRAAWPSICWGLPPFADTG
jgi:hypothetical protein